MAEKRSFSMRSSLIWLAAGLIGLAVFLRCYDKVFPVAAVDLRLSQAVVLEKAEAFLREQGVSSDGYDRASMLGSDDQAAIYLQKTVGIARSNELIKDGFPLWFWRIRWFKELDKEELRLGVDPADGRIIFYTHAVLEDAPGAHLVQEEARRIAERFLTGQNIDLDMYRIKESESRERRHRTDHYFVWEHNEVRVGDAFLRVQVGVQGEHIGSYSRYLKIPETFGRELAREVSLGTVLGRTSHMLMFILLIAAVFYLIFRVGQSRVQWQQGFLFMIVTAVVGLITFMNAFVLKWNVYPTSVSKSMFIMTAVEGALSSIMSDALLLFAFFTLGAIYARQTPTSTRASGSAASALTAVTVGYALAGIFLGYVTVFYYGAIRFFNIWMPPGAVYSNILGTPFPFVQPLMIALSAALTEEFSYRMLGISFLRTAWRRKWPAVIATSLLWGLAHSFYQIFPMYIRGIELTLFGIVLGAVYCRYGLETVIVAHFVIDAVLAGLPLFKTHDPLLIAGASLVIAAGVLLPLLLRVQPRFLEPRPATAVAGAGE